jgi:hypothetical protein
MGSTASDATARDRTVIRPARLPAGHPPVLVVVLDDEEEFEWEADFTRTATAVSAMACVDRAQALFDEFGIRPTYVVTHPVASQPEGCVPLREIAASGRACIGAHLHPWVTPPFDEPLCRRNSFPGNLPAALERAKLRSTTAAIRENLGVEPQVYQAGRYGLGPNTRAILEEEGYLVDCSVLPAFDYRHEEGPDFSGHSTEPSWSGALLNLPLTAACVGHLGRAGAGLHRWAISPAVRWTHLGGLFARLGLVERLRLSPEGYSPADNRRLTDALQARGHSVFCFSFHTPSLKPGCTPYVRSEAELSVFLDRCRSYFDDFLGQRGGISLTPLELRERLAGSAG